MVDSNKVDRNILYAFNQIFQHFPRLDRVWIIDRYSCYTYNWANEWTTKFYPLLKKISRTWLVEDQEYNGVGYGFPKKHPSFPNSLGLGTFPSKLYLKIPKEKSVIVTWLEQQEGTKLSGVTNSVSIWEKTYRIFPPEKKERTVEIDCDNWLLGSGVITGECQLIKGNYDLLLYSKLGETISKIETRLNIPSIQVLTACDFDYRVDYQASSGLSPSGYYSYSAQSTFDSVFNVFAHRQFSDIFVGDYKNPLFQTVPDSYHSAWIQIANNNFSKNTQFCVSLPDSVLDITCYKDFIELNKASYSRPFQKYYYDHPYWSTYRNYNISFNVGNYSVCSIGSLTSNFYREGSTSMYWASSGSAQGSRLFNTRAKKLRLYPYNSQGNRADSQIFTDYDKDYMARQPFFILGTKNGTVYEKIGTGNVSPNILNELGEPYQLTDDTRYCWYRHNNINGHSYFPEINDREPLVGEITSYTKSRFDHGDFINQQANFQEVDCFQFSSPHDNDLFESQRVVYTYHTLARKADGLLTNTGRYRHPDELWRDNGYRYNANVTTETRICTHIKYQEIDTTNLDNAPVISLIHITNRNEVLLSKSMSVTDEVCLQWYDPGWHENNISNPPPYEDYSESKEGSDTYLITLKRTLRTSPRQPKIFKEIKGEGDQKTTYQEVTTGNFKPLVDALPDDEKGITKTVFTRFTKKRNPFVIEQGTYYILSKDADGIIPPITLPSSGKVIVGFLGENNFYITLFGDSFSALNYNNKAILFWYEDDKWNYKEVITTMADSPEMKALCERVKLLSRFAGITTEPDGKPIEYPEPHHVDDIKASVVQGLKWAGFGKAKPTDPHPAGVYEVLTNRVEKNALGKTTVKQGGIVKIFNFMQWLEQFGQDIGKGMGLQESGGIQVTKGDGSGVVTYQSQLAILIDILKTQSADTKLLRETVIANARQIALLQSILAGLGVKVTDQNLGFEIEGETHYAVVATISPDSPSLMDNLGTLELGISYLVGGNLTTSEIN
jgi:hypothetical protein